MRRRRRSEGGPGRDHGRAWRGVWLWPPLSLRTRLSETQESKLRCKHAAPAWSLRGRGLCGRGGADAPGAPHSWRSLPGTSGQHVAPITVPKACARGYFYPPDGGGGGGGRLLPTPDCRRGPGGPGSAFGPDSGIQLCARGAGGPRFRVRAQTPPRWPHCPLSRTHRNTPQTRHQFHSPAQAHMVTLELIAP